jgi:hypothetical protein
LNHGAVPVLLEGPANIAVVLSSQADCVGIVNMFGQWEKIWCGDEVVHSDYVFDYFPFVADIDKVQFDNAKIRALLFGQEPIAESIF